MEIRLATAKDFDIFLLTKKTFFVDYNISKEKRESGNNIPFSKITQKSKSFYEREFADFIKNILILAIDGNKVIGYLAGKIETSLYEKYGYISEVFIRKEYRGKNISTSLKNKFLDILKEKKINLCRVEVSLGNPAEEIYKKWNFKVDKHRLSLDI